MFARKWRSRRHLSIYVAALACSVIGLYACSFSYQGEAAQPEWSCESFMIATGIYDSSKQMTGHDTLTFQTRIGERVHFLSHMFVDAPDSNLEPINGITHYDWGNLGSSEILPSDIVSSYWHYQDIWNPIVLVNIGYEHDFYDENTDSWRTTGYQQLPYPYVVECTRKVFHIRGSVRDVHGNPYPFAEVRIVGAGVDEIVRADSSGVYTKLWLWPGQYVVTPRLNGVDLWTQSKNVQVNLQDLDVPFTVAAATATATPSPTRMPTLTPTPTSKPTATNLPSASPMSTATAEPTATVAIAPTAEEVVEPTKQAVPIGYNYFVALPYMQAP